MAVTPRKIRIIFIIMSNFYMCPRGQGGEVESAKSGQAQTGGGGERKSLKKCGHPLWMAPMPIAPFLSLFDMKMFIRLMLIFLPRIFLLFLLTGLQTNSNNFSSITFGNN